MRNWLLTPHKIYAIISPMGISIVEDYCDTMFYEHVKTVTDNKKTACIRPAQNELVKIPVRSTVNESPPQLNSCWLLGGESVFFWNMGSDRSFVLQCMATTLPLLKALIGLRELITRIHEN